MERSDRFVVVQSQADLPICCNAVYFAICPRFANCIKIGRSCNLRERRGGLSREWGSPITILAYIECARAKSGTEVALHRLFAAVRTRGEWFAREPVLEYLKGVHGYEPQSL